jgi:hypothetical protein
VKRGARGEGLWLREERRGDRGQEEGIGKKEEDEKKVMGIKNNE